MMSNVIKKYSGILPVHVLAQSSRTAVSEFCKQKHQATGMERWMSSMQWRIAILQHLKQLIESPNSQRPLVRFVQIRVLGVGCDGQGGGWVGLDS